MALRGNGVTRGQALRVWWFLFWAGGIAGWVLAILIAAGVGFLFIAAYGVATDFDQATAMLDSDRFNLWTRGGAFVIWIGWSLHVVRMAIRRQYKGFRIELIPDSGNAEK